MIVCFKNSLHEFGSPWFVQMLHYFGFKIQLALLCVVNIKVKNLAFDTSKIITNACFSMKNYCFEASFESFFWTILLFRIINIYLDWKYHKFSQSNIVSPSSIISTYGNIRRYPIAPFPQFVCACSALITWCFVYKVTNLSSSINFSKKDIRKLRK